MGALKHKPRLDSSTLTDTGLPQGMQPNSQRSAAQDNGLPMFGRDGDVDLFGRVGPTRGVGATGKSTSTPTLDAMANSEQCDYKPHVDTTRPYEWPLNWHDVEHGAHAVGEAGHLGHLAAEMWMNQGRAWNHLHHAAGPVTTAGQVAGPATALMGGLNMYDGFKNGDVSKVVHGGVEAGSGVATTAAAFGLGGEFTAALGPALGAGALGLAVGHHYDDKAKERCYFQNDGGRCESASDNAARKGREVRHKIGGANGARIGFGATVGYSILNSAEATGRGLFHDALDTVGALDTFGFEDLSLLGYDEALVGKMSEADRKYALEHQMFADTYRTRLAAYESKREHETAVHYGMSEDNSEDDLEPWGSR